MSACWDGINSLGEIREGKTTFRSGESDGAFRHRYGSSWEIS
jgi:hypothetical protein